MNKIKIESSKINRAIIFTILYSFFFSYFTPLLNFNDLYILKFLKESNINNTTGYIFKIDNKSILIAYIYVSVNILTILIFYHFLLKKISYNVSITIGKLNKKKILINFLFFFILIFYLFMEQLGFIGKNYFHILIQLLFFHSTTLYFLVLNEKKFFYLKTYLIFNIFIILFYYLFITTQIYMVYILTVGMVFFFFLVKVNIKKIFVFAIVISIILLGFNFTKVHFRNVLNGVDYKALSNCNFTKINGGHCGKYKINTNEFRNDILPLPPSTFKIIYKFPNNPISYNIYSSINRGFERLLKINYLASDIASLNNKLGDNFKSNFLNGSTYKLLKTKFIPRSIYPEKPTENLGQFYGHEFQYLPRYDISSSENLGSLNESYINFGFYGFWIYPSLIIFTLIIIIKLVKILREEFKILAIISIPIFITNSIEANTSGWFGGIISYLLAIVILNYATNIHFIKNFKF